MVIDLSKGGDEIILFRWRDAEEGDTILSRLALLLLQVYNKEAEQLMDHYREEFSKFAEVHPELKGKLSEEP